MITILSKEKKFSEADIVLTDAMKHVLVNKKHLEKVKAEFYLRRGYVDKAESMLSDSVRNAPEDLTLRLQYARSLFALQLLNQAIDQTNEVLKRDESNIQAHILMYEIYTMLELDKKANSHLAQVNTDLISKSKRVAWLAQKND